VVRLPGGVWYGHAESDTLTGHAGRGSAGFAAGFYEPWLRPDASGADEPNYNPNCTIGGFRDAAGSGELGRFGRVLRSIHYIHYTYYGERQNRDR
jgi:hypothetical protein